jgi:hypothetical protein
MLCSRSEICRIHILTTGQNALLLDRFYFLAARSNQPTLASEKAPIAVTEAPSICSRSANPVIAFRIKDQDEHPLRPSVIDSIALSYRIQSV